MCSLLGIATAYADDSSTVNFYNWGEYIDPSLVPAFEQQTGITVNQNYFDSDSTLKAKLLTGHTGYDLVVPEGAFSQEIQAGLFLPLDKSKIPNYKLLSPAIMKKMAVMDPGNVYGIAYSWGTIGIAYNVDKIRQILGPDAPVNNWEILLDPKYLSKLQGCGISYLDDPVLVYGVTLHYLGMNPNSTNPEDFIKATNYLMGNRQYLTYFSNSSYIFDLAGGNLCLSMAYSGDAMRARNYALQAHNGVNIKFVIPQGGAPIWFDVMAIPKGAPHIEATYKFINYLLDPKNQAVLSNYLFQPNATPASEPYLNSIMQDPNVTPPDNIIDKLFIVQVPPPKIEEVVSKLWLQVRYGIRMD
ncbi:MAG: bacterial extracellular solute-binding family protein [Gammaproteobacteria bacterium]|jgi:putrescine transport system substrate-binding protein|nr:bacterial extracellular solute-binding family protein [Gammaproteobacteria bacterium]